MTGPKLLTFDDLIDELDMGKATLKFILNRFNQWLATNIVNGEILYTQQAVTTLLTIRKWLDAGMLPEQVETSLEQEAGRANEQKIPPQSIQNISEMSLNQEMISVFKDMFQTFIEKQDRIASAQETLARVEERKAAAMEKRAVAEDKKADAMTTIALALQELNHRHVSDPHAMEIAGRAVETLALNELSDQDDELPATSIEQAFDPTLEQDDAPEELTADQLFDTPFPMGNDFADHDIDDLKDFSDSDIDDLSLLVNDNALAPGDIDDLSSLIDAVSEENPDLDDLESLLSETSSLPDMQEMDDLSKLIHDDDPSFDQALPADIDDLSKLISQDTSIANASDLNSSADSGTDTDDLYSLVGMDPKTSSLHEKEKMDDLSMLITSPSDSTGNILVNTGELDDLSALISDSQSAPVPMDDLSKLVGSPGPTQEPAGTDGPIDDLWALVPDAQNPDPALQAGPEELSGMDNLSLLLNNTGKTDEAEADTKEDTASDTSSTTLETPSLKPDISPDLDLAKYKAAVMKIIIDLKNQGLTAQQTTDRLNHDGVTTLSGKPSWRVKAIEKIYGFIDSAK